MRRHTHAQTHTQQHYAPNQKGEAAAETTHMACQLQENPNAQAHTLAHARTRSHTHALRQKQKTKPSISNRTLNLQQTQIQNYFTMLPFLIQKMPILGVYIYIFFSVVYC